MQYIRSNPSNLPGVNKMKDKYYKTLHEAIDDAMELWIEVINEDEFADGASMDSQLSNFMQLVTLLYDSRLIVEMKK